MRFDVPVVPRRLVRIPALRKLDALREAQLWMLQDPKASKGLTTRGATLKRPDAKVVDAKDKNGRTSPQFWAAFVLSGDWR